MSRVGCTCNHWNQLGILFLLNNFQYSNGTVNTTFSGKDMPADVLQDNDNFTLNFQSGYQNDSILPTASGAELAYKIVGRLPQ